MTKIDGEPAAYSGSKWAILNQNIQINTPPDLKRQVIAPLLYTTGTYLFLYFS